MLISFKQYLVMLAVGPCLLSLPIVLCFDVVFYPRDDCRNLTVDPEAAKMLELPVETQLVLCGKEVNFKIFQRFFLVQAFDLGKYFGVCGRLFLPSLSCDKLCNHCGSRQSDVEIFTSTLKDNGYQRNTINEKCYRIG